MKVSVILFGCFCFCCQGKVKERSFFYTTQERYNFVNCDSGLRSNYKSWFENFGIQKKSVVYGDFDYYKLKNDPKGIFNVLGYIRKEGDKIYFRSELSEKSSEQIFLDFDPDMLGHRWRLYQDSFDTTDYLTITSSRMIRIASSVDSAKYFYIQKRKPPLQNKYGVDRGLFLVVHEDIGFISFSILTKNNMIEFQLYPKVECVSSVTGNL
ncbi:MAG TPA: hypothetical protein VIU12_17390 [Chryseolinea sp.]